MVEYTLINLNLILPRNINEKWKEKCSHGNPNYLVFALDNLCLFTRSALRQEKK